MIASAAFSSYQYIMTTKVLIGSDHGGYALKSALLAMPGVEWVDCGVHGTDASDYPDTAHVVAQRLMAGEGAFAILICGTGVGISIAANRHAGIRAALCADVTTARLARQHNDANILALGGRMIGPDLASDIVTMFLSTPFSGEDRHKRRLCKIEEI